MKRIFTFIGCLTIAASLHTKAQSQRLVLVEEFTNASCGPCATQNPTFNTLIGNNSTKVVSIKYQTVWPGTDPMNAQNPTDAATRVSYYGVTGVPFSPIDGDTTIAPLNNYYYGAPHNIVQSTINTKYAIPSPFDVALTHSFSADYDSIFITMNITNTQALTGALKAHIALVEKTIIFPTAPGSNGEKEFYYVMRKMYPNANGTTVTATGLGQTQTITVAAAVPAYTYDINQLAVVGFIQDNNNWNVKQAAFSDAQPLSSLVGIRTLAGVPTVQCTPNYTPVLTVKNLGTDTLYSFDVNYHFDNNPNTTLPITCNILPGLIGNVTLPQITSSAGEHTLYMAVTNPNNSGLATEFSFNKITKKAIVSSIFNAIPLTEGFEGSTFPPSQWYVDNQDNGPTWTRKTGAGASSSSACAKMDIFASTGANLQVDDFYAPGLDLTNAVSPVTLDFAVASQRRTTTSSQKLEVRLSFNCGVSWINVYSKIGANLATTSTLNNSTAFTPTAAQWRTESIDLDAYIGQPNVLVQFRATKNGGNNIYIDDINFYDGTLRVKNLPKSDAFCHAYQISENYMNVNLKLDQADNVAFEVYNILGKKIYSEDKGRLSAGNQSFAYSINDISSGIYIVKLTAGDRVFSQKVNINK